jgi:hypothetical protein
VKKDPRDQGVESEAYLTPDPFKKVSRFDKGIGTEDETTKNFAPKLPDGRRVEWAFFTFDGAKRISSSTAWAKIHRPTGVDLEYKDIREITSIQFVRKT